jgi:protein MpaA
MVLNSYYVTRHKSLKGFGMNKKWTIISTVCTLFAILAFAGCVEPVRYPVLVDAPQPPTGVLASQYRIIGTSIHGWPIMSLVLGRGPDVTFILATIHGNEPAGTPLVRRLTQYLRQHPDLLAGRTVVLLRTANPDGLAHNSRYNAHGVDLNRNFEAANRINSKESGLRALSEPEARVIRQLILQYKPDRIVSIHQPLACIDYDGPARMLADRMAQYCALPVKKLGAKPGSLGSYAGVTLGIPIITFEMLRTDSQFGPETLWQRYGKALLAAIVYPNTLETTR